jgi:diketogulonate reductase-like aldo/keto reductase
MDMGEGGGLLMNASLQAVATVHKKSVAQILLKWNTQRGVKVHFDLYIFDIS